MQQLNGVSAKRLKNLTKMILLSVGGVACGLVVAAPTEITAKSQIAETLNASLEYRIQQRFPELPTQRYEIEFQLQSAITSLDACSSELTVDWRGNTLEGRQTAQVRCPDQGWQLYVPVSVTIRLPVVVAAGSLSRGQHLTEADLTLSTRDIGSLRMGYYQSESELVGFEIARNLNPGEVITSYVADPPVMIARGDRVVIIASSGGLSVRTLGVAQRDGGAGEQIPVRNIKSRKIVHAYIKEKGVVEIPSR